MLSFTTGCALNITFRCASCTVVRANHCARAGPTRPPRPPRQRSRLARVLVTRIPLLADGVRLPYLMAVAAPLALSDGLLSAVSAAFILLAELSEAPPLLSAAAAAVTALGARLLGARVLEDVGLLPHLAPFAAYIVAAIAAAAVDPDLELGVALSEGPEDVRASFDRGKEEDARDEMREQLGLDELVEGDESAEDDLAQFDKRLPP